MSKFTRWGRDRTLDPQHQKIKLGQVREILSAYFGHRTYACFGMQPRHLRDGQVCFGRCARDRALSLQIPLTEDEWYEVETALKPSGISGSTWLISEQGMRLAA